MSTTKSGRRSTRLLFQLVLACLAGVLGTLPAHARTQTFGPFTIDSDRPGEITLGGEIDLGAALDFRRALSSAPGATTLVLDSPGGAVAIGLLIADDVDRLKLATVIPAGAKCFSACSFVFLAGSSRHAFGSLGVHQISSDSPDLVAAQRDISDIIDILTRFGTPAEVLTIMFRTPPDQIYVFSAEEIARFHIERDADGQADRPEAGLPAAPAVQSSEPDPAARVAPAAGPLEAAAEALYIRYLSAWSGPNGSALAYLDAAFDATVTFYGKPTPHRVLMADKRKFAERWPLRAYSARPGSISARCDAQICTVTGLVDWFARSHSRNKTATGVAELTLVHDFARDTIVAETGKVLKPR